MKPAVYEGSEAYIFISYAHKDSDRVFQIVNELAAQGYRIWYDEGIAPGSEWPENIAQHLNAAGMVMAFLSPNAVASPHCRREINFALSKRKPFLSVVLEKTEMPLGMEMQLSAQQSIPRYNYAAWDEFIDKILKCPAIEPCRDGAASEETADRAGEKSPACPSCGSRQLRKEADGALVCDYCGSRIFPETDGAKESAAELEAKLYAIYNEALEHKNKKEYPQELAALLKGLSLTTTSDLLMLKIGRSYRRNGNSKKAMEYYEKARALNPDNPLIDNSIGVLYFNAGHYEHAIPYYKKSIELMLKDPLSASKGDLASNYDNLGYALGKIGETKEAVKYLRLAKENGYSVETLKSDCKQLNIPFERLLDDGESASASAADRKAAIMEILTEAYGFHEKNQYEEEFKTLCKGLDIDPDDAVLQMRLGRVERLRGHYTKALEHYRRVKQLAPEDPMLYGNLAAVYINTNQLALAKENYDMAFKMVEKGAVPISAHDTAVLYSNYGMCLGKMGDMAGARKYLRIAKDKGYSMDSIKYICEQIGLPLRKVTGWF